MIAKLKKKFGLLVLIFGWPGIWGANGSGTPSSIPGTRKTLQVKNAAWIMVYIPAGEFLMGSAGGWVDERPPHRVRIRKDFWLGQTEVTQALWQAVMGINPSFFRKGGNYPVEQVSWRDCQVFIRKLNNLTKMVFRLPSEAEWEYACRAGSQVQNPPDLDAVAWHAGNSAGSTHPVGLKKPNAFGLHDMLGNVWEWCADWYGANYYARSPLDDPAGPSLGLSRVDRGGAYTYGADVVRPARRDSGEPDYRPYFNGLRLASRTVGSKNTMNLRAPGRQ